VRAANTELALELVTVATEAGADEGTCSGSGAVVDGVIVRGSEAVSSAPQSEVKVSANAAAVSVGSEVRGMTGAGQELADIGGFL
jgi:hypothetical protein